MGGKLSKRKKGYDVSDPKDKKEEVAAAAPMEKGQVPQSEAGAPSQQAIPETKQAPGTEVASELAAVEMAQAPVSEQAAVEMASAAAAAISAETGLGAEAAPAEVSQEAVAPTETEEDPQEPEEDPQEPEKAPQGPAATPALVEEPVAVKEVEEPEVAVVEEPATVVEENPAVVLVEKLLAAAPEVSDAEDQPAASVNEPPVGHEEEQTKAKEEDVQAPTPETSEVIQEDISAVEITQESSEITDAAEPETFAEAEVISTETVEPATEQVQESEPSAPSPLMEATPLELEKTPEPVPDAAKPMEPLAQTEPDEPKADQTVTQAEVPEPDLSSEDPGDTADSTEIPENDISQSTSTQNIEVEKVAASPKEEPSSMVDNGAHDSVPSVEEASQLATALLNGETEEQMAKPSGENVTETPQEECVNGTDQPEEPPKEQTDCELKKDLSHTGDLQDPEVIGEKVDAISTTLSQAVDLV